jgi:hypothetical protein
MTDVLEMVAATAEKVRCGLVALESKVTDVGRVGDATDGLLRLLRPLVGEPVYAFCVAPNPDAPLVVYLGTEETIGLILHEAATRPADAAAAANAYKAGVQAGRLECLEVVRGLSDATPDDWRGV